MAIRGENIMLNEQLVGVKLGIWSDKHKCYLGESASVCFDDGAWRGYFDNSEHDFCYHNLEDAAKKIAKRLYVWQVDLVVNILRKHYIDVIRKG